MSATGLLDAIIHSPIPSFLSWLLQEYKFSGMKEQPPISIESILSFEFPCPLRVKNQILLCYSLGSVQFSRSLVSNSLQPHGLQHSRPPCPSPTPRACSDSCPSSWWCHPAISSSVVPRLGSAPNPSQHQSLFQWVSSSHQAAKVLELQL